MKVYFTCLYCDNKWNENVWNDNALLGIKCSICKETKLLKAVKETESNRDVFGYRYSPPFSDKKNEKYPYWNS